MAAAVVLGVATVVAAVDEQWPLAIGGLVAVLLLILLQISGVHRQHGELEQRAAKSETRLAEAVESTQEALRSAIEQARAEGRQDIGAIAAGQTGQIEALLQLFGRIKPRQPMPPSGGWALDPRGLLNLFSLVERSRPRTVVELGSGTSTVWVGYALAESGSGRLISLEHDETYVSQSRAAVALHGDRLPPIEVRHAPLTDIRLGDEVFRWYDLSCIEDINEIDFLIVDGPPGRTGRLARYPAVPVLLNRLSHDALVVLDDFDRADEQAIVERWIATTPGLSRVMGATGRQAVLHYLPQGSVAP
jgi:predicted O-methyltransferase YrrM